jgi:hypothetical protein
MFGRPLFAAVSIVAAVTQPAIISEQASERLSRTMVRGQHIRLQWSNYCHAALTSRLTWQILCSQPLLFNAS